MNPRKIHRKIAPIAFLPLLATALTGVIYRLSRNWFGLSSASTEWLMSIHQGEFLGKPLVSVYILFIGMGLLGLIVTGSALWLKVRSHPAKQLERRWHRLVGPIALLPLSISAFTGLIYTLARRWFGLTRQQVGIFLAIHEGRYLGLYLQPLYILLIGSGLVFLLVTGIRMSEILPAKSK